MGLEINLDIAFRKETEEAEWYKEFGMSVAKAGSMKYYNKFGKLSMAQRIRLLERKGYILRLISPVGSILSKEELLLEENIEPVLADIMEAGKWYIGTGMGVSVASQTKRYFRLKKLSIGSKIEILEKLGYGIELVAPAETM